MFIFRFSIRALTTDLWYVVINSRTGTREFYPVENQKFENTLIWLHDYNEDVETASGLFLNSNFFAKSTKIILPGGPERDINYKILGFKVHEKAWYNMN
jgi:hypothetical protein